MIDSETLSSLTALDRSSQTEFPGSEKRSQHIKPDDIAAGRAATGISTQSARYLEQTQRG
jgi:hypothetical protein